MFIYYRRWLSSRTLQVLIEKIDDVKREQVLETEEPMSWKSAWKSFIITMSKASNIGGNRVMRKVLRDHPHSEVSQLAANGARSFRTNFSRMFRRR